MWEQEEKIMQKVKTVQDEPAPVRKETSRRLGLRDLSHSLTRFEYEFIHF
jgi:hypothetical protein